MVQTLLQTPLPQEKAQQTSSNKRQVVATLLGKRTFEAIDWRRLMQEGVLVRLHIRHCGFTTRLSLEDLGITVADETVQQAISKLLVLGEKRLLPEVYLKALGQLESRARQALKERSFRTELGAFLPSTVYPAWKEATEALQAQYGELRDELIANHRAIVKQILSEYEVVAKDTYQRMQKEQPDVLQESEEQFIANYCNRIAAQIPTPERIRKTFDFRYLLVDSLSQMQTPSSENTTSPLEDEQRDIMPDALRDQAQQREWARAVLERDLRTQMKERIEVMLDSFLGAIVTQLRSLTYDAMIDVLSTMQKRGGESFSPRSVMELKNVLAQVRNLNFYGDTEIDKMMAQVEDIVGQTPAERQRSRGDIQKTLRAIATITRATCLM